LSQENPDTFEELDIPFETAASRQRSPSAIMNINTKNVFDLDMFKDMESLLLDMAQDFDITE